MDTDIEAYGFSIQDEFRAIQGQFSELLALDKPVYTSFFVYSNQARLLSFELTGNEDTYLEELAIATLFLCSINHPKFILAYDSILPYLGNQESSAIVTAFWSHHRDPIVDQVPYRIENSTFISLQNELTRNEAVNAFSAEIAVNFEIIELAHGNYHELALEDLIDYMVHVGIEFSYYNGTTKQNLAQILNRDFYTTELTVDEKTKKILLNKDN